MAGVKNGPSDDQLQRLMGLEGKLLDVALEESDPDKWISAEQAEAEAEELDRQAAKAEEDGFSDIAKDLRDEAKGLRKGWKGQRYWEKKNATATVSLLTKLELYRQRIEEGRQPGKGGGSLDDDAKIKADVKEAEKKVKSRLALVKKRAV
jgi:hypothetical protein